MLVCRAGSQKSAGDTASGSACCRLALFHRQPRTRTRRYPSDMTDGQWRVIDRLLPDPASLHGDGRPEERCRRDIVDAIFYLVDNGTKWRLLPVDFPPWPTVYRYMACWEQHSITQRVLDGLRERVRIAEGRTAEPSAAIIDSQSVKAAEEASKHTRGFDAGKKINGRKRHIAVDTLGLLLVVMVTAANVQDRDAAKPLLHALASACHRIRLIWADGGYTGKLLDWTKDQLRLSLHIVKRSEDTSVKPRVSWRLI